MFGKTYVAERIHNRQRLWTAGVASACLADEVAFDVTYDADEIAYYARRSDGRVADADRDEPS